MKVCFKCKRLLPLSEFYKHPQMGDGHLNKCKDCTKKDVRVHRINNDSVREYDTRRYREDPKRKENKTERTADWRKRNPEKHEAHKAVQYAVKTGKLIKLPCEICGAMPVLAHHEDYSKPLEVKWYCALHHARDHSEYLFLI